jgi:hypothetical protein
MIDGGRVHCYGENANVIRETEAAGEKMRKKGGEVWRREKMI